MDIIKVENGFMSNNYILINGDRAILIDCSIQIENLKQILNDKKLCGIIITHGHFDHFYTLESVIDYYKCNVYMHEKAYAKLTNATDNASEIFQMPFTVNINKNNVIFLKDRDVINLIGYEFEMLEAFGHTDDSILIKLDNNIFTGDFIFKEGYGRTDFSTGNFQTFKKYLKKHLKLLQSSNLFYGH